MNRDDMMRHVKHASVQAQYAQNIANAFRSLLIEAAPLPSGAVLTDAASALRTAAFDLDALAEDLTKDEG